MISRCRSLPWETRLWCSIVCAQDYQTQCDTIGGNCFRWCGYHSEKLFVCIGAKPTERICARNILQDRKRTREGRSQGQWRVEDSQEKESVKRWVQRREETSQQNSKRQLLRPVDLKMPGWPTREDKSALLVACGSFTRVHARVSPQKHRMHESVTDYFFLALGANPSPCLFVLLYFHPLGWVFCVCKGMWNTPGMRWEKPLEDLNGHE